MKLAFYCMLALALATFQSLFSQVDTVKNAEQFLFPEFTVGVVRMKSGEKVKLDLNYNIVQEKMVFMQKGNVYDIINQMTIDTVYISNRKFIPKEKMFYEILEDGPAKLFVQHKGSVIRPSRPAAYGGTTEASATTYINNMTIGNQVFRMNTEREVKIKYEPVIIVERNKKTFIITSSANLLKALGNRKSQVKDFILSEKTDTGDPEQVRKVLNYYNGLPE